MKLRKWLYRLAIYRGDNLLFKSTGDTEYAVYHSFMANCRKHVVDVLADKSVTLIATYSKDDITDLVYQQQQLPELDAPMYRVGGKRYRLTEGLWYFTELRRKYDNN
jgi:hypothetical protein